MLATIDPNLPQFQRLLFSLELADDFIIEHTARGGSIERLRFPVDDKGSRSIITKKLGVHPLRTRRSHLARNKDSNGPGATMTPAGLLEMALGIDDDFGSVCPDICCSKSMPTSDKLVEESRQ